MTTAARALDANYWSYVGHGLGAIVLYAIVGLVLMVVGFYAIDLATPGPLRTMVNAGKPNAIIVTAALHRQHGADRGAGDLRLVGTSG